MSIRVALIDDHSIVRAGVRLLINGEPDMEVVGEGADGEEAVRLIEEVRPDVLILDLAMPKQNGLLAIGGIRRTFPQTKILVLTMHDDAAYLRTVLSTGGTGYVLKTAEDRELLTAIRTMANGKIYVNATLRQAVYDTPLTGMPGSSSSDLEALTQLLTEREREVLQLVAAGYTNQEISERIKLSVKSVEAHRARVMEKLNLQSRAELVRFALDCGLLASADLWNPLN